MNDKVISVLIPAYNVERYLPRCLDSVLSQTFKDFEVIVIDDGSTDGTGNICDDYAEKDSRVKVYHQENKGISATRELCLQYASGEYIQFVDSDDWIDENMLGEMYAVACRDDADVVGCNFYEEYGYHCNEVGVCYSEKNDFFKDVVGDHWGVLWKLLMRKSVIDSNGITFPRGINGGEDYVFVVQVLYFAKNVVSINRSFYHYNRMNSSSTISTPSYSKVMEQVEATRIVENFLTIQNVKPSYDAELLRRKFYCKMPLMKIDYLKWRAVFPECNSLFRQYAGKKLKILCFVYKLKSFVWNKKI